ncbi:hypothetical protein E3N88_43957 [Mikania micrantha]|uniref:Fe2OG dioxygenase domain-containing protein n=1 Tax=Mikania micrantha TaxID=192012 RepID=A0A5N6LFP4_9ASTR|nr:hypothetical protein E3N88_43957 [Mikania micrantha]
MKFNFLPTLNIAIMDQKTKQQGVPYCCLITGHNKRKAADCCSSFSRKSEANSRRCCLITAAADHLEAVLPPRDVCYIASEGLKELSYSGYKPDAYSWDDYPPLKEILEEVHKAFPGSHFNSLLINRYNSGNDYVGWHADDEKLYGPNPEIVSISFGCERDFCLKKKHQGEVVGDRPRKRAKNNNVEKHCFKLKHGSLLLMRGNTQRDWLHSVPKRAKAESARINLTFRRVMQMPTNGAYLGHRGFVSEGLIKEAAVSEVLVGPLRMMPEGSNSVGNSSGWEKYLKLFDSEGQGQGIEGEPTSRKQDQSLDPSFLRKTTNSSTRAFGLFERKEIIRGDGKKALPNKTRHSSRPVRRMKLCLSPQFGEFSISLSSL